MKNTMRSNFLGSALILLLFTLPLSVFSQSVLDQVAGGISSGNSREVAKYFDSSVEITILDRESSYSKTQGEMVLRDFFSKNPVNGFELKHRGTSGEGSTYGIGTMRSGAQQFRVYYYVKQKGAQQLIQEIRFEKQKWLDWKDFIQQALAEDVREGDHTSLSCIKEDSHGKAQLHVKDEGILAGVELAEMIFRYLDPGIQFRSILKDGEAVRHGQIAFELTGNARAILIGERLALNCMQRMSGIATLTHDFVQRIEGFKAKILDTRKTTPLFRAAEKWAVRIGGGVNHRFGLYDMILIKDNHIDYCGGIVKAIEAANQYLKEKHLTIPIEVETRTMEDVKRVIQHGGVNRIMLDNFTLKALREAVKLIAGKFETEASGGVNLDTVRDIAETGVDYISVGAITHSYRSLDLSLKALIG